MIHNHWLSVAHHDSHRSHLLYFVSWSCVSPHHWPLYDTCHTYSTLWVVDVYPHIIDTYMTPVILTLLCELIMCIPTSLTPIWHLSYLLYFVSWSCVSPHHWHLYDTCHTYSTLCIPTSLTPIWHLSYLLYFVYPHIIDTYMTHVILTLLCVSPHHWLLYDTCHTYSTLCIPTSLTPIWHLSYLLYFVNLHIIDPYMTPVILTLLCELIMCIPTSLTPIWHLSYLLYFVYPHIIDTYMTPVILYFVYSHIIDTYMTPVILTLLCVSPHHWHLSYLFYFMYPHIIDTYITCCL